jgi:transcriptional regulator with XRE-family HTH domain
MAAGQTPRARFLGAELRDARTKADVSVRELARRLGIGHAKVSFWENGKKIPKTEDVARYLTAIEVTGDELERLLEMARLAEQPNWLLAGVPGIAAELGALMEFEKTAREIVAWAPLLVPGLLQTGDYARAIMGAAPTADTRVAMRLGRRDILTRRNPVQFTAVIGEGVLREGIAEPEVMAAQLDHLKQTADLPNVTVQIMPSRSGYHPGLAGPFVVMEFPKAKPIVHLEHHRASAFVFDDDDVAAFVEAAGRLRGLAMSPEESAGLIAQLMNEMESP